MSGSGDDGLERDPPIVTSVMEWDMLLYVEEATLAVVDFGEPSRDFCLSEDLRLSACSGETRPARPKGRGGTSWEPVLLDRKRERKPCLACALPGDAGTSCSKLAMEPAVRSRLGLGCFLIFLVAFVLFIVVLCI